MTRILFEPANPESLIVEGLRHVFAVDAMLVSYPAEAIFENGVVAVSLATDSSCRVHFPWRTTHGEMMISTSSLPQRDQPYRFELELARGTVGLLMEKFAEWRESGKEFTSELIDAVGETRAALVNAIFQSDAIKAAEDARVAINCALSAAGLLVDEFVARKPVNDLAFTRLRVGLSQRMVEATDNAEKNCVAVSELKSLSLQLPDESDQTMQQDINYVAECVARFREAAVEAPAVPVGAETMDPTEGANDTVDLNEEVFQIGLGPILDWKNDAVDDWFPDEKDFDSIRNDVFRWGHAFASQVDPQIAPVYVASGIGAKNSSKFTDHQRLQLTLDTMSGIHQGNPDFAQMVSFYQPIGSEINGGANAVSPLHAADALLRTDVRLEKIGLEVSFADFNRPSNRQPLQISSLIGSWQQFELALSIVIELPAIACIKAGEECGDRLLDMEELHRVIALAKSNSAVEEVFLSVAPGAKNPSAKNDVTITFTELVNELNVKYG